MKNVFIVDDNNTNLYTAQEALSKHFNVFTLPSASSMFELLNDITPDLLLLDIKMPQINGFDAYNQLRQNGRHKDIPVIFLTSHNDIETEVRGLEMGAVDFIHKPFSAAILFKRVQVHLQIDEIIRERTAMLEKQNDSLRNLRNSMVSVLSELLESRDKSTGGHIERTSAHLKLLIQAMVGKGVYADEIKSWDIDTVVSSARLHDVGKIAISDLILNKPGSLTDEEFEIMKIHATEGERIIEKIISQAGEEDFLLHARLFAGSHHERWDGHGYPRGLKGDEIPLQGRIMAIVDVYDSLISDRPYKKAYSHEKAIGIIKESSGSYFEPKIAEVFLEVL